MLVTLLAISVIYVNGILSTGTVEVVSTVRFINSGNYNMHHITTESGSDILVDCGFDAADYALRLGVDNIFAVIITDTSAKRYNGLEELCDVRKVKYVVLPSELKEEKFHLENCEVLYYNQNDYKFYIDNVKFRFYSKDGEKSLLIQIYDDVVAVPLDKTVSDAGSCTVLSVPDKCKDIGIAAENNVASYYVHPTYNYTYYDNENKYITSQVVSIVFREGEKPEIR